MKTFRFLTTFICHLDNGETKTFTKHDVFVEAHYAIGARGVLDSVITDMLHDNGDKMLPGASLDRVEIVSAALII